MNTTDLLIHYDSANCDQTSCISMDESDTELKTEKEHVARENVPIPEESCEYCYKNMYECDKQIPCNKCIRQNRESKCIDTYYSKINNDFDFNQAVINSIIYDKITTIFGVECQKGFNDNTRLRIPHLLTWLCQTISQDDRDFKIKFQFLACMYSGKQFNFIRYPMDNHITCIMLPCYGLSGDTFKLEILFNDNKIFRRFSKSALPIIEDYNLSMIKSSKFLFSYLFHQSDWENQIRLLFDIIRDCKPKFSEINIMTREHKAVLCTQLITVYKCRLGNIDKIVYSWTPVSNF